LCPTGEGFANSATTVAQVLQTTFMSDQSYEGWFTDPYAIHEARWLSDGRATKLVRDGGVESYDEPPPGAPSVVPERIEALPSATNGSDLLRSDDAERADAHDSPSQAMEALDSFAQSGLLDVRHPYSEDK
jgi:hypothetical protein